MKIKKSNLKKIIEAYMNEQMSTPERPDLDPANVKTDNQKQQYNILHTADGRRIAHPDSEADSPSLRWPQDFVLFENQFKNHVKMWKLFKRDYPKSAFLLQIFDLSGVSSYGDLAESIEIASNGNSSIYDQIILGLNIFGSLPIGMLVGLFSGRISVKALNSVASTVNSTERSGFKAITGIIRSSDNYGDIMKYDVLAKYLKNTMKLSDTSINNVIVSLAGFFKFIDSFSFRAFMKSWAVIAQSLGNEIQIYILEYLDSESGQEFINSSDITHYLFKKLPERIGKYLDLEFSVDT